MDSFLNRLLAEAQESRLPIEPDLCRLLRLRAGLTQEQLAQAVQVSRPTIARYESGARKPKGAVLARYLAVLDEIADSSRARGAESS